MGKHQENFRENFGAFFPWGNPWFLAPNGDMTHIYIIIYIISYNLKRSGGLVMTSGDFYYLIC